MKHSFLDSLLNAQPVKEAVPDSGVQRSPVEDDPKVKAHEYGDFLEKAVWDSYQKIRAFQFEEGLTAALQYQKELALFQKLSASAFALPDLAQTHPKLLALLVKLDPQVEPAKTEIDQYIRKSQAFRRRLASLPRVESEVDETARLHGWATDAQDFRLSPITARTVAERIGNYFAVDVETTGLNPMENEIVQVAAVRFQAFQPVSCFMRYVKPHYGIQPRAARLNGITEEQVRNAPYAEQIRESFLRYTGKTLPLVGHNIPFDLQFLAASGFVPYPANRPLFDTLSESRKAYELTSYRLDYVDKVVLRISREDAHDALSDALITGVLFAELVKRKYSDAQDSPDPKIKQTYYRTLT